MNEALRNVLRRGEWTHLTVKSKRDEQDDPEDNQVGVFAQVKMKH